MNRRDRRAGRRPRPTREQWLAAVEADPFLTEDAKIVARVLAAHADPDGYIDLADDVLEREL